MWVENNPRPYDFCGRVGCPLCYHWKAGGPSATTMSGLAKLALDLLQRPWEEVDQCKQDELRGIAGKMHDGVLLGSTPERAPPPEEVDIGMDARVQTEGWLRQLRTRAVPERRLTLDEIAERRADRERVTLEKNEAQKGVVRQAREIAKAMAEATKEPERPREPFVNMIPSWTNLYPQQQQSPRPPPEFVDYLRGCGVIDEPGIMGYWDAYLRGQLAIPRTVSMMDGVASYYSGGRY